MVSPKDKQTMRSARSPWGTATCVYWIRRAKIVVSTNPKKKKKKTSKSTFSCVCLMLPQRQTVITECIYFRQWPDFMLARVSVEIALVPHSICTKPIMVGFSVYNLPNCWFFCLFTLLFCSDLFKDSVGVLNKELCTTSTDKYGWGGGGGWMVGWGRGKKNGRGRRWVGVWGKKGACGGWGWWTQLSPSTVVCLRLLSVYRGATAAKGKGLSQSNPAFLCNQHIGRACPHFSHH